MISYVAAKYDGKGDDEKRVAQIITFGKLQARAAIRDVGRVLGLFLCDVDRVAKLDPETLGITLDEALEQSGELRARVEAEGQVKRVVEIARRLEGLTRHASTHAAGVVIGDRPLIGSYRSIATEVRGCGDPVRHEVRGSDRPDQVRLSRAQNLTVISDAEERIRQAGS